MNVIWVQVVSNGSSCKSYMECWLAISAVAVELFVFL